jgi:hypothetical protein
MPFVSRKCFRCNALDLGGSSARVTAQGIWPACEDLMQMAITFMAVVAGMVFSLAVALLAEELIFGQVFRLFFSQQAMAAKTESKQ